MIISIQLTLEDTELSTEYPNQIWSSPPKNVVHKISVYIEDKFLLRIFLMPMFAKTLFQLYQKKKFTEYYYKEVLEYIFKRRLGYVNILQTEIRYLR